MIYTILRSIVGFSLKLYYKELKVNNRKNIPEEGPLLLISNHPNTLVDAFIVGHVCQRPIYFLAKATFFNSSWKRKLLSYFNIIPINRESDQKIEGVDNSQTFKFCYEALNQNKVIAIFPEGTSYLEHHLRTLKTGAARIALEATKINSNPVQVVPIGLSYMEGYKFRSTVNVEIGKPITFEEELEIYSTNSIKAAKQLTQKFQQEMSQLIISFENKEQEHLAKDLFQLFDSPYLKNENKGVSREIKLLKTLQKNLSNLATHEPEKMDQIKAEVHFLKEHLSQLALYPAFLDRKIKMKMFLRQIVSSFIFIILGFPVFIFGFIHNFLVYKLVDILIPKLTKDIEYYAPLSILLSLLLYPINYLFWCILLLKIYNVCTIGLLVYVLILPITGLFAHGFWNYIKHINFKTIFVRTLFYKKEKIEEIKKHRELLRCLVLND